MSYILETVNLIPFFYLKNFPFCTVIFVYLFSLIFCDKRVFVWLLALIQISSFSLVFFHGRGGVASALGYGSLLFFLIILLWPLLWAHTKKQTKSPKEKKPTKKSENFSVAEEPFLPSAKPAPQAVALPKSVPMPGYKAEHADVQLEHVFGVLKKLQSVKLSAGDRLETDVIYNMLTVYRSKGRLSAEETRSLNNYLATLLKLMSKYSL